MEMSTYICRALSTTGLYPYAFPARVLVIHRFLGCQVQCLGRSFRIRLYHPARLLFLTRRSQAVVFLRNSVPDVYLLR